MKEPSNEKLAEYLEHSAGDVLEFGQSSMAYRMELAAERLRQGKLMWIVGDGQLFEYDDKKEAEDWAFRIGDEPALVRVTVTEK